MLFSTSNITITSIDTLAAQRPNNLIKQGKVERERERERERELYSPQHE